MPFFSDFQRIGCWGREDFLTASLGALMCDCEPLREAFIGWLQRHVHVPLENRSWSIGRSAGFDTGEYGLAYPDLVLLSGDLEIWCEHKVDAPEGRAASKKNPEAVLSQLARYQLARKLAQEKTGRQILLVYITAARKPLSKESLEPIHGGPTEGGYVWPEPLGHFRWHDFHRPAKNVLANLQAHAPGSREAQLLEQFLEWWGCQGDLAWHEASATLSTEPVDPNRAGLWPLADAWLDRNLAFRFKIAGNYNGTNINRAEPDAGEVSCLMIQPVAPFAGWPESHGPRILRVSLRGPDGPLSRAETGPGLAADGVRVVTQLDRAADGTWLRISVALQRWDELHTSDERQQAICAAVATALLLFQEKTGMPILRPDAGLR